MKSAEVEILGYVPTSLPAWGVWIEIYGNTVASGNYTSLTAWGVWIEMHSIPHGLPSIWSLPAWGVWIEIEKMIKTFDVLSSRSPHGECGLK